MGHSALLCVSPLPLGCKVEVLGLKKDGSETVKGIPGDCGLYACSARLLSLSFIWHIHVAVVLQIHVFLELRIAAQSAILRKHFLLAKQHAMQSFSTVGIMERLQAAETCGFRPAILFEWCS
jgi:hypothetical protein